MSVGLNTHTHLYDDTTSRLTVQSDVQITSRSSHDCARKPQCSKKSRNNSGHAGDEKNHALCITRWTQLCTCTNSYCACVQNSFICRSGVGPSVVHTLLTDWLRVSIDFLHSLSLIVTLCTCLEKSVSLFLSTIGSRCDELMSKLILYKPLFCAGRSTLGARVQFWVDRPFSEMCVRLGNKRHCLTILSLTGLLQLLVAVPIIVISFIVFAQTDLGGALSPFWAGFLVIIGEKN